MRHLALATGILVFCGMALLLLAAKADDQLGESKGPPEANYSAEQGGGNVTLFAKGTNPTGGWKNELELLPVDIYPPEFRFTQTKPSGQAIQILTPFLAKATAVAPTKIDHVFVTDASGKHKVTVEGPPEANYSAEQAGGKVNLFAKGTNPTGGWKNELELLPIDIYPPEFRFTQAKPSGQAIQILTPFLAKATAVAPTKIDHVFVTDASGKHKVTVEGQPEANYSAEQAGGKVNLFAKGTNPTGGWKNELELLPIDIYPPEFRFTQAKPSGQAIQILTPFLAKATAVAPTKIDHVFVTDASGKHKVTVTQVP